MGKTILRYLILVCVMAVAGCAGTLPPVNDVKDANAALVYGYIDMSEAPTGLGWIVLKQAYMQGNQAQFYLRVSDGFFYLENVPIGIYQLQDFGGDARNGTSYSYRFPRLTGQRVRVTIRRAGVYYLGSFKYQKTPNGQGSPYSIVRTDSPSEASLLKRLLGATRGTGWEKMVRTRLNDLGS